MTLKRTKRHLQSAVPHTVSRLTTTEGVEAVFAVFIRSQKQQSNTPRVKEESDTRFRSCSVNTARQEAKDEDKVLRSTPVNNPCSLAPSHLTTQTLCLWKASYDLFRSEGESWDYSGEDKH